MNSGIFASLAVVALVGSVASADIQTTFLDAEHQGEGNKGASFRPVDINGDDAFFLMTAGADLDQDRPYDPNPTGLVGTTYIDDDGAGVQGPDGSGSKGISGKGGLGNEELIFTFDSAITAHSISIQLVDIEFGDADETEDKDDPVLFLSTAGSGTWDIFIDEFEIRDAFSDTADGDDDDETGIVTFSLLSSLGADLKIDAFKIRETNDHMFVNQIMNQVPAPASLALLGLGGLLATRGRERRDA